MLDSYIPNMSLGLADIISNKILVFYIAIPFCKMINSLKYNGQYGLKIEKIKKRMI